MKVALLGATGFMGSAILNEALDRGQAVTAIARDAGKLPTRDRLIAKFCDIFQTAQLAALLRGQDAVISAFNPGWKNPRLYEDQIKGTASIIAAITEAGLRRVLWVGGAGPGGQTRRSCYRRAGLSRLGEAGVTRDNECARTIAAAPGTRMVFPCALGADGAGHADREVPPGRRCTAGRCARRRQDFGSGFRGRHDRELEKPNHVRQRFTVGY